MRDKTRIAIAAGDPAGIGPEVSLKAALDPAVRNTCKAIVVGDAGVLTRHAAACAIAAELRVVARAADADWSGDAINVLGCAQPDIAALDFGTSSAASAAERDIDRARRHRVRRLSIVRGARDRHRRERRLPDAVLR
jgi:4-hydroxythreonine-4-phosphate dehydrogenase